MGYLLLSSVLSLVALSATFAVSTAFVALLRMTALRGHDLLLCRVWKAVLIFSLIPVNISLFLPIRGHMTAIIADRISQLTQSYYTLTVGESAKNPYSGSDVVEHENGSIVLEPVKSDDARLLIDPTPYVCSSLLFVWFTAAAVKFVLPLREYAAGKKRLELYSMPLEVGHAREIFDECAMALELHARPELMVIAGGRVCSPCVCGIFSPCVYIDAETASLSDEKLRYIFIHELSHIKLGHQQLKLLTNAVSAIHWFNPAASRCAAMVACDCELACDRNVLLRLGSNSSDRYMLTILEVARRICAVRAYTEGKTLGGGLFLSEKSDKQFMERRYANMMIMPAHKFPKLAIVSVFTVCILFSVVATASCGLPKSVTDAACSVTMVSYTTGSDLLDEGIRAYYGINFDDPITAEMLDGITTVEIRASDMLAESLEGMTNIPTFTYSDILKQKAKDGVFVEFVINGVEIDLLETAPSVSRFEGTLGKGVYEYSQSAESNSMESRYYTKWFAFYCKKDPSDPELSDADRAEMIAEYPDTLVHPAYIFDPYATVREKGLLIDIAYKSGLLDDRYLEGGVCDASSLATLHNLKTAVFTGVTPINFDETLKVHSEAETKYIEANKLYETATDDTADSQNLR